MGIIVKIGWRNIFRNRRRTLLTAFIIAIGLTGVNFMDSLMIGMQNKMIDIVTGSYIGDGIIRSSKYDTLDSPFVMVNRWGDIFNKIKNDKRIKSYTYRLSVEGMISSSDNNGGVLVVGIPPQYEKDFSTMNKSLIKGDYIKSGNDILIGKKLADYLKVDIGDRIIITVPDSLGNPSQDMFRVCGIYKTGDNTFDGSMSFISVDKMHELTRTNGVSEIIFRLKDKKYMESTIWNDYTIYGNVCKSWKKIMPAIDYVLKMSAFSRLILYLILSGVVYLAVVNTLFMAIYERFPEFGILRSIGTTRGQLVLMVLSEGFSMGFISIIIGLLFFTFVNLIFMKIGIDYRGIEVMGVTLTDKIYPRFSLFQFTMSPLIMLFIVTLSSLYPAIYAAKLNIVKIMRKE